MTIQTTIGKTYAVTSAAECTITTPEGILIATCAAGEQTLFVAPATEIEISDDAALVTESFKGAPAGSAAAGGLNNRQAAAVSDIVENHLNNTITEPPPHAGRQRSHCQKPDAPLCYFFHHFTMPLSCCTPRLTGSAIK